MLSSALRRRLFRQDPLRPASDLISAIAGKTRASAVQLAFSLNRLTSIGRFGFFLLGACTLAWNGARAWEIGGPADLYGTNAHLSHQWITFQAWQWYQSQFGPSEIDAFIGELRVYYPTDPTQFVIEGVYDEDMDYQNPFGDAKPSLRHFWDYSRSDRHRRFDDGLGGWDSAANRSIKYMTGGYGLTGYLDGAWGGGQWRPESSDGIRQYYRTDFKGAAYYYLGHVAHLLQDIAMPAHAQDDQHLTGVDDDPLHDWVDGQWFTTGFNDRKDSARFEDFDPYRYTNWYYSPSLRGIVTSSGSVVQSRILSPTNYMAMYLGGQLRRAIVKSVPPDSEEWVLPLYLLFTQTALNSVAYDSKDYDGYLDGGARRQCSFPRLNPCRFNLWTKEQLNEVADFSVPLAMAATAELFRFFYSIIDETAPTVAIQGLSGSVNAPTCFEPADNQAPVAHFTATASDTLSGVELAGFKVDLWLWNGSRYLQQESRTGIPDSHGGAQFNLDGLAPGLYSASVNVENGAGIKGYSPNGFFQIAVASTPPPLSISRLPFGFLAVSWPLTNGGFVLESALDLAGPWSQVPLTLPNTLLTTAADAQKFFRLASDIIELNVTVTATPQFLLPGETITTTYTVRSVGRATATNVRLLTFIPDRTTLLTSTPSRGTCANDNGIVTCELGALPPGTLASLTLTLRPDTFGSITNLALATASSVPNAAYAMTNTTVLLDRIANQFGVNIPTVPNGSVSPAGNVIVQRGDNLLVAASPNPGFKVDRWWVYETFEFQNYNFPPAQIGGNTFNLTNIQTDWTIYASFEVDTNSFQITAFSETNGLISPDGTLMESEGGAVLFTALPTNGFEVGIWYVDNFPAQIGGIEFLLDDIQASHTVEVTFEDTGFNIEILSEALANGTVEPMGQFIVPGGTNMTFTATPQPGYIVDRWYIDGSETQVGGSNFSVNNITASHEIQVSFILPGVAPSRIEPPWRKKPVKFSHP